MKLTIWGAARQVTGSMHLLELDNGYKVLIDCGLDYEQQRFFNSGFVMEFPFNPASINALILTHAHIDHSGNIPLLVNHGFRGDIICTPPTADLVSYLLLDSVKIQLQEANKKNNGKKNKVKPLYTEFHVHRALDQLVTLEFHKKVDLKDGLSIEFFEAGHILGAASVKIQADGKTIGFTGDIGNPGSKLVRDAEPIAGLDYLVSESTYGGRFHQSKQSAEDELLQYIHSTCVDQPGRLIIPAFSVGRTQSIVFTLHQLKLRGLLPPIKIFVDSPLAIKTTHLYEKYRSYLNDETEAFYQKNKSVFEFDGLEYLEKERESEAIMSHFEPCIIVSAAGMVEGGRIQEHIRNNIGNSYANILIAGFCAEGTLGYRLLQGQNKISIKGRDYKVYSGVFKTDVFSAPPDQKGLMDYIQATNKIGNLKRIFLVHGEEQAMDALAQSLYDEGLQNVSIPQRGQTFQL